MKLKWKMNIMIGLMLLIFSVVLGSVMYMKVTSILEIKMQNEFKLTSSMGMLVLDSKYPGQWSVKNGKLYKGTIAIDDSFTALDEIRESVHIFSALYVGSQEVAVSNMENMGPPPDQQQKKFSILSLLKNKSVATQGVSQQVIDAVLKNGESFSGKAAIAGMNVNAYYTPIKDETGKIIGMWSVCSSRDDSMQEVISLFGSILVLIILMFVVGIMISIGISRHITKDLEDIQHNIASFADGDFSGDINGKILNRKDEIGHIGQSISDMQQGVKKIIRGVLNQTHAIEGNIDVTNKKLDAIQGDIEVISATTQQLSAGLQQTSASATQMNQTASNIEQEMDSTYSISQSGKQAAQEIKQRAQQLKTKSLSSKAQTQQVYSQAHSNMMDSIEKSKSIEQITLLTQTIFAIASETNLLSLNANIEAARAGEAGRGFSIVADEIRKLSESSKQAATQIQQVTQQVLESVEALILDSKDMLSFIDNNVFKDYEMLIATGEQYSQDAVFVEDLVSSFTSTTEKLRTSVKMMTTTINEISIAANEGAEGSSDIAERAVEMLNDVNALVQQSNATKHSSNQLLKEVGEFRV
jgi:methyl-accepting chemotaxis protein